MKNILTNIFQPRMMLIAMIWLGGGFLAFLLIAAMLPQGRPGIAASPKLLVGDMKPFEPAFPPRKAGYAQFEGPDGMVSLDDFKGQVVLVNLWATWCTPCLEEMPSLDKLAADLAAEDFSVVAIAADPTGRPKAQAFLDRLGIENLALYTDQSLDFAMQTGGINALPISILYDARGNEVGRLTGTADWAGRDAKRLIRAVLAGEAKL